VNIVGAANLFDAHLLNATAALAGLLGLVAVALIAILLAYTPDDEASPRRAGMRESRG
jgi:hypothetical protein